MEGLLLLLRHPQVAALDCGVCEKHCIDDNWLVQLGRDGMPELRILDCGSEFLAPCRDLRTDNKGRRLRSCPKGTPEQPNTLSPENEMCYEHYLECQAVGEFPDDSVVRRNAAVIRGVIESVDRSREVEFQSALIQMIGLSL